jgi:hypothetical protein
MIVAASALAPKRPIAKSGVARPPANGPSARAASAALSISKMPASWSVTAVATTMKRAITFVHTAPPIASACSRRSSSSSIPFSATADCR